MNKRPPIKRATVMQLGLVAALAAGGFLVSRLNRNSVEPVPMQTWAEPGNPPQVPLGMKKALPTIQQTETIPNEMQNEMQTLNPAPEEAGYESPFASTNHAPADATAAERDSDELYAALTAAAASGNVGSLVELLHSGSPETEIEAVRMLARIGGGEALAAALGKLLTVPVDSPDYDRFIQAFADCHSAAAAQWLTEFLGQTQSEDARLRVRSILAALRGPEVVDSLAASLANPADAQHAKDCAELLASAIDPEQVAVLSALLETGTSVEIQTSAASGLASVGSGAAVDALVAAGSSTEMTAAAIRELLATVDSSYGQEALIQAALNSSVPLAVRQAAIRALSTQPGQRTQTVLANLGQTTSDPGLKTVVDQALQDIKQNETPRESGSTSENGKINGELLF